MAGDAQEEQLRARLRKFRHDLSNPLAAILAETQLLLLSPEQFNRESLDSLKQIETLARRMRQILDDATA
ncbi:MAG TPA: histidine kinase dimerization/phospho-acceptor domain-containing protein [Gemmatimonadales bacterium]|jgi:signal transduction histidine kinase|nr:histidine kinase dimerization/phospho-acceptor domain-containing protein [Gemmatimonadales bacterium]